MKKWKSGLIVALMLGMGAGLAQAGVVIAPTGSGGSSSNTYTQSSFDNHFDSSSGVYTGQAWGSVSDDFVITSLSVSLSTQGNSDPMPNSLGTFYMSVNGRGYHPENPASDPLARANLNSPPSVYGSVQTNEARIEQGSDDKGGTYDYVAFDQTLALSTWTWSSPWLNTETNEFSNYLSANFAVKNGIFTSVSPYYQENVWSDLENPAPGWFSPVEFGFSVSGDITGENFSVMTASVPEPATCTLMVVCALASACRFYVDRRRDLAVTRIG